MKLIATSKSALAAFAAIVLAASLVGCSWLRPPAGVATSPVLAGVVAPPTSGAMIGVYRPPGPFDVKAMDSYLTVSPKRPAIIMWYQQWGSHGPNRFDAAMLVDVYERGAIPMISWEPWDPGSKPHNLKNPADSPAWSLQSIASGKRDAYLRSWALGIKALGGPVMLRPMHEMNGNWYPWSGTANGNTPAEFASAWRHIHDVFRQVGATNVTWVWSVNQVSRPSTAENRAAVYYPGDAYVDWVSSSGFNWGGVPWKTFDDVFGQQLAYLKTLGKPIIIGESACVETGGNKAAWIADTYRVLRTEHPQVKAIIYYDAYEKGVKHGIQDWRITSSKASALAYRNAVSSSYFVGGPVSQFSAWQKRLSAAQRHQLAAYRRIY